MLIFECTHVSIVRMRVYKLLKIKQSRTRHTRHTRHVYKTVSFLLTHISTQFRASLDFIPVHEFQAQKRSKTPHAANAKHRSHRLAICVSIIALRIENRVKILIIVEICNFIDEKGLDSPSCIAHLLGEKDGRYSHG